MQYFQRLAGNDFGREESTIRDYYPRFNAVPAVHRRKEIADFRLNDGSSRSAQDCTEKTASIHALSIDPTVLPATTKDVLEQLFQVQGALLVTEQVPIHTDHLIHAGMYVRTITLPPETVLMGALVKIPTVVTTVGEAKVFVGEWIDVQGYSVLPAKAHRKQIFVAVSALIVSMTFPTTAHTVEEAEREFTDEHELLLSHRQDLNSVRITGE